MYTTTNNTTTNNDNDNNNNNNTSTTGGRHRLNEYLAQRVPSRFLASSFTMCLNCGVLKGMFPWRTRYPLS